MGVGHNRWFVERRFVAMVGPGVLDQVIDALLIESSAPGLDLGKLIKRLESSIGVSEKKRDVLHPILQAAL